MADTKRDLGLDQEIIKDLNNLGSSLEKEDNEQKWDPKVFIFTSIDLVNSTVYKKEDKQWPTVFKSFFDIVECQFNTNKRDAMIWKYAGDEILFYEEITDINTLITYPSEIFQILNICQEKLFLDRSETKNKLYLKAVVWCALVKDVRDSKAKVVNIITSDNTVSFDFLGEDIDEGFRLSQYTSQTKLVLDTKLAYLLYKNRDIINTKCDYVVQERIKIVGYRRLKGIWDNRIYPIIWYHKEWSSPDKMFLYDEHETSDIVNELKNKKYLSENLSIIEKIVEETGLDETCKQIEETIRAAKPNNKLSKQYANNFIEIHLATVCIRTDTKEALIVKRASKRELLSELWEFGCAKGNKNWTIKDSVTKEYKEDFGIDVELIIDRNAEEDNPIPISTYEISKNRGLYKGIIFVAKIMSDPSKVKINNEKHESYRWIKEDEIDNFNESAVPDFHHTLKKAFYIFKKEINDEA